MFDDIEVPFAEENVTVSSVPESEKAFEPAHNSAPMANVHSGEVISSDEDPFGEMNLNIPGATVGSIGMTISRFAVEKARFTTTAKARIAIVTNKIAAVKLHYHEGSVGSYCCFNGVCCKNDGFARVRYLLPIVKYDTDSKGIPVSTKLSYQVLVLGKDAYDNIVTMAEMGQGGITNLDLIVNCVDEKFQKVTFIPAGNALWKRKADLREECISFWKKNMSKILEPVANVFTESEYLKALSNANAENVDMSNSNVASTGVSVDDIFG